MSNGLQRQSRDYCPETCPDVDRAFSEAIDKLKDIIAPTNLDYAGEVMKELCEQVKEVGTEKLRDALCTAIRDKNDMEEESDELQGRVRDLESKVDDLENQVSELERELAEVTP